jgi:hypothetical protein
MDEVQSSTAARTDAPAPAFSNSKRRLEITAVYFVCVVLAGVGLSIYWQNSQRPAPVSLSTATTTIPSTAVQAFNSFDERTLKVGDKIGSFVVTDIAPLHPELPLGYFDTENVENIKMTFAGNITLEGIYDFGELFGAELGALSAGEIAKLPSQTTVNRKYFFLCIDNPENLPPAIKSGESVSVAVSQYIEEHYPSSGCSLHIRIAPIGSAQK